MKTNAAGISLIKSFEGCKLLAYRDQVGVLTVGYGHTGADVYEDMEINQAAADQMLNMDLRQFEAGVNACVKQPINENQFSALVCFAYNVGLHAIKISTLLKKINKGDMRGAAAEFVKWDHAGGKVCTGLLKRRMAETELFNKS